MDDITEKEKEIVDELRKRTINDVTPKMLEDVSLFYRFAKARDFDLSEAETMLRKHIVWRKEMQIDTILTDYEPSEVLVKYAPTSFICFDRKGSIVRHIDCGRADLRGIWNLITKEELGKFFAYNMEKDKDMLIKNGRNLGKPMYSSIYDFENLSYANAVSLKTLQYAVHLMKIFVDHYPECISRCSIINAPFYFAWIYSAIKPVLPNIVLQKVQIFGSDGWKEALLKHIDPDELPACLGGNKTDPDGNPLCETIIMRGKPIPKDYNLRKDSNKLALASDVEKLTVKPLSKEEITFEVKEENSYLQWEIEIKSRDISFSLIFRGHSPADVTPVEILYKQRINSSDTLEKECYKCEKVGHYNLVFDNSYSWIHSKEVYYRMKIKKPTDTEMHIST